MGLKRRKSVKHPPPAPSSEKEEDTSGGAEDSSPEEEAPKTLTLTQPNAMVLYKSRPAKPQPSNTKTPIPTPTQNNDSVSEDDESKIDSDSGSESESDADEKEVGQQAAPTPVGTTTAPVGEKRGSSSEAAGIPVGKKPFQQIWSAGGGSGKGKVEDVENDLGIGFHAAMENFVMNKGMELLDADKRAEIEDEWKKLQLDELKLYTRRLVLLKKWAALQD